MVDGCESTKVTHRAAATALGILAILVLCAVDLVREMFWTATSTTVYECVGDPGPGQDGRSIDGPVTLSFVERRALYKPTTWDAIEADARLVQAATFPIDTGSMGGSQGLRWRGPDGTDVTAILSFSDLMQIDGYGVDEIGVTWSRSSGANARPVSQALICIPVPSKSSRG